MVYPHGKEVKDKGDQKAAGVLQWNMDYWYQNQPIFCSHFLASFIQSRMGKQLWPFWFFSF